MPYDPAVPKAHAEYLTSQLGPLKNPLPLISLGEAFFDAPPLFTGFLYYLLERGVSAQAIFDSHILQAYFIYHRGDREIITWAYDHLAKSTSTAANELAKLAHVPYPFVGVTCWLDGTPCAFVQAGEVKSPAIQPAFSVPSDCSVHVLWQIFSVSALYHLLKFRCVEPFVQLFACKETQGAVFSEIRKLFFPIDRDVLSTLKAALTPESIKKVLKGIFGDAIAQENYVGVYNTWYKVRQIISCIFPDGISYFPDDVMRFNTQYVLYFIREKRDVFPVLESMKCLSAGRDYTWIEKAQVLLDVWVHFRTNPATGCFQSHIELLQAATQKLFEDTTADFEGLFKWMVSEEEPSDDDDPIYYGVLLEQFIACPLEAPNKRALEAEIIKRGDTVVKQFVKEYPDYFYSLLFMCRTKIFKAAHSCRFHADPRRGTQIQDATEFFLRLLAFQQPYGIKTSKDIWEEKVIHLLWILKNLKHDDTKPRIQSALQALCKEEDADIARFLLIEKSLLDEVHRGGAAAAVPHGAPAPGF